MATLTFDKTGNAAVYVLMPDGKRKPVRLGKLGRQKAERARGHIHEAEQARLRGIQVDPATRQWLEQTTGKLRERLAGAGLVEAEGEGRKTTLGRFIDTYLTQRSDLKPGTLKVYRQAQRHLQHYIGKHKPLIEVTPSDAEAFLADLLKRGIAPATAAKWCRVARHFFTAAHRRRLIDANPFAEVRARNTVDVSKRVFVPADAVWQVIDVAPDPQWKLLIALARFGGLRTASEPLALTWRDVDFAGKRFIVRADKTAHHAGGGVRVVPMFPELEPLFQQVFDEAEPGSEYVISRYRDPAANLRTQLVRYIEAAGLTPWPRPWQNLRVSRATELADLFPSHVAAAWLGHTEKIADQHYRQVTDEHFERAIVPADEKPVRKAVRAGGAPDRMGTISCGVVRNEPQDAAGREMLMGAAGFEPA